MPDFDYQGMVHEALRQVVRIALEEAQEKGLLGDHHFFVTFDTQFDGVEMPSHLQDLYPESMTVILQHQFWDLEVGPESFGVTLAFSGRRQRLEIPYAAIQSFADPGAEFGLQFRPRDLEDEDEPETEEISGPRATDVASPDDGGSVLPFAPRPRGDEQSS